MLVLIGSHTHCNSFVVNQFLFFPHQMEKISFVIRPRRNDSNAVEKKCFVYFLLAKDIFPCHAKMVVKNGNGNTLLLVLEATSYQMKIFRHISFVCKVATCKSIRKLILGLLSISVYNNGG